MLFQLRGKLLTDGLELYDIVAEQLAILHFGCAQHARTYVHKAPKVTELPSGRALARVAMEDYLGKVFKAERTRFVSGRSWCCIASCGHRRGT